MDLTPIPTGNDVRVNTFTTGDQRIASVTALAGDGFVVTWQSNGQDGSGAGIYGQRYAANGTAVGSEFRVNTFTTNGQSLPSATALAGGGFVVTWSSLDQDGSGFGIYGQRYAADGTASGSEFRVNTFRTNDQLGSSVTALAGGGFVVTWSSLGQDGSIWGIYGQRYAANGTAVGSEFRVNTFTNDEQLHPSVAALADGGFVVTWSSLGQDGSGYGIYGQRYAANGTTVGSEFRVNTFTADFQIWSSVTALAGDGFVVTWQSKGQDGSGYGIYGQRYAANGTAVGSEFRVNTYTTSDQRVSSVTALAGGGFAVTWESLGQDGSGYGIYGQRYAADGTAVGSEFRVNQITAGNQSTESFWGFETVAALADGRLVQVWYSDHLGSEEVFFRLINVPNIVLDDAATTTEDTPVNIQVLANDGGFEGTPAIIGTTNGAHGTVAVNNNGTPGNTADDFVVYTPTPDFNGTDSFTYTLNGGSTATVTVTVTPAADILSDMATTNEDTAVNVLVLGNDNFEGTPAITATTNGAHGTVAVNNNGTPANTADDFVVYTPNADFSGTDSFTYTVTSGGATETETVSVAVNAVADIAGDTATTNEDTAVNVLVLGNDTFEGTPAITATTNGAGGTVAVNNNGTPGNTADDFVVYTPNGDFNGTDSFTYTVTSGGVTETATVSVTVNAAADIVGDTATTNEDTAVNVLVLGNDTFEGTEEITGTTNGTNGTVAVNNNGTVGDTTDDFVVYTPNGDFNGTDSFTYTVTSGGVTETATASVTISAVQDAFDDSATVSQNTSANPINVLANDFFEGTEQITAVTQGTSGTVVINDNGTAGNTADDFVTYTPNTGFFGNDTFTYTVTSPTGAAETATVSVSVAGNATPVITSNGGGATASVAIPENSTAVTTVTATDPDGQTLGYSIAGGADSAFFGIDATGALAFITGPDFEAPADAGANNIYDVTVQVSDGNGGLDAQAIAVTVTDVAGATINASNGGQTLNGTGEQELILGGSGKDALNGGGGDDTLYGGNGKDTLNGGAGNNILTGGNASDDFLFGADATGFNSITDFANDHLRLIEGVTVTGTVSTSQGIQLHLISGGDIFLSGVHVSDWHQLL